MSALLATACAVASVLLALHRPPRPARLLPARPDAGQGRRRLDPRMALERLGAVARRAVGLRPEVTADRRTGALLVLTLVVLLAGVVPAALAAAVAFLHRRWARLRSAGASGEADVERAMPDLIDLLALAIGAGLSVHAALPVVSPVSPAALRADLRRATEAIAAGRGADDAVVELGQRWGAPARPLVHALTDHLRYGTPLLPALERVATEARTARRRAAEVRARRLPVLLLFPLVLCTLPAFGMLTVAPLVAGTFDSLHGGHLEAPASLAP